MTAFRLRAIPWGYGNLDRLEDRVISGFGREVDELAEVTAYLDHCGLALLSPPRTPALSAQTVAWDTWKTYNANRKAAATAPATRP